jgi:hypothetical protein
MCRIVLGTRRGSHSFHIPDATSAWPSSLPTPHHILRAAKPQGKVTATSRERRIMRALYFEPFGYNRSFWLWISSMSPIICTV